MSYINNRHVFFALALVLLFFSLISLIFVYYSANNLFSQISGRVSTGEVNLTVETLSEVNFTTQSVSWGSGRVDSNKNSASLTTSNYTGIANVTGGNWTLVTAGGMKIENLGSSNVTINLTVSLNASNFIGGTNPVFEWNLSSFESGSCLNSSANGEGGLQVNRYYDANTTPIGRIGCSVFPYESTKDSLRLEFNLTIPEDSSRGSLGNIITVIVSSI